jgi:2-keto-3-deoxy-L-rhamnonate aldolase RhmA
MQSHIAYRKPSCLDITAHGTHVMHHAPKGARGLGERRAATRRPHCSVLLLHPVNDHTCTRAVAMSQHH